MKRNTLNGRILKASEVRRMDRRTIWVLSYRGKAGKAHFLGSFPLHDEAVQAGKEEFAFLRKTLDVVGYDARLVDQQLC
jgi:hypothetical protein